MEPVPALKIMIMIAVGITAITAKLLPGVLEMNVMIRSKVIIFFKKIYGINLVAMAVLPLLGIIIITHRTKMEKAL